MLIVPRDLEHSLTAYHQWPVRQASILAFALEVSGTGLGCQCQGRNTTTMHAINGIGCTYQPDHFLNVEDPSSIGKRSSDDLEAPGQRTNVEDKLPLKGHAGGLAGSKQWPEHERQFMRHERQRQPDDQTHAGA